MSSLNLHGQTLLQELEFKDGRRDPEQKDVVTDSMGSPAQMDSPTYPNTQSRTGLEQHSLGPQGIFGPVRSISRKIFVNLVSRAQVISGPLRL